MDTFKIIPIEQNQGINKIKKEMYEIYCLHENILVCSYFGSWCLLVLDTDFNIVSKYWNEKEKILKCFNNFIKHSKIDLSILGYKKIKKDKFKDCFIMDLQIRNCWYDF